MSSSADTQAPSSSCSHEHHKNGAGGHINKTFKVRVFLDVDNTLYRYEDTKFHDRMHDNLANVFAEVFPGIEKDEATGLCNEYHAKYGLSLAGLAIHHHSDERPIDLKKLCRQSNSCDYSVLNDNPEVKTMLEAMKDEDGYDLWLFTNADMPHAVACVEGVGIHHLFHESDGYFKCVDCLDQWADSPLTAITNKPFPEAYACADKKAQSRYTIEDNFVRVMVDDALMNMEAPAKMGWVTVWVAHGRKLPEGSSIQPTLIIERVEELRDALKGLFAKQSE